MPSPSRFPVQYITNTTKENLQKIQALAIVGVVRQADIQRQIERLGLPLLMKALTPEQQKDFEKALEQVERTWMLKEKIKMDKPKRKRG